MKIVYGLLIFMINFSVCASDGAKRSADPSFNYALSRTPQETSDVPHNTIRFSGRITEPTCGNKGEQESCGAIRPLRTREVYSFGSIVTLTYL